MDNIFKDIKYCCLVHINDIFIFSKITKEHNDDVLTITQRCIIYDIVLRKKKSIYAKQEIEFLGPEVKLGQVILQKHILEKIENVSKNIEDMKQLELFFGCLTYASHF